MGAIISEFFFLIKNNKILIYLFISINLLILDFTKNPYMEKIRFFTLEKLVKVESWQISSINKFNEALSNASEFVNLKAENAKLKEEKRVLEKFFLMSRHMEQEYLALKKLMNIVPEKKLNFMTSFVLGDLSSPYGMNVMVNGGEEDGIKKGQAVINQDGLVGRVIEVLNKNSRIMLLNDLNSHIPIITEKTRERAIVSGTNNQMVLRMKYLADDTKIEVGEFVFTSGDGKIFPPGLLVGTVSKAQNNEYLVTPAVDFRRLDYVILVEY